MIKNTDSQSHDFLIKEKHISKRRTLRFAAVAMFTAFLFVISQAYPVPTDDTAASKNMPGRTQSACPEKTAITEFPLVIADEAEPACLESESTLLMESISDSGATSAVFDKDGLLSVVDALSADEDVMLSIPGEFGSGQKAKLQELIDSLLEEDHNISFILLEIDSGNVFCLNPASSYYSASTIKGPYVAALNQFTPEIVSRDTKSLMKNTIMWSSNEDFETLHNLYGNEALYEMAQYTDVSDSIIDEYNWYPYLTPKELTKLWIGIYWYFFEDTNENSRWCRELYTESLESFINSALVDDYTVYTKPGWYIDWEDVARNDAGILLTDEHAYILTIMSDAFGSYDELEELTAILGTVTK